MNRYPAPTFRPAFGIAAVALSAVTLSVAVLLPLTFASGCPDEQTFAARAPVEVAIVPARIEVVAAPARTVKLEPVVHRVKLEPVNVIARRGLQST